MRDPVTLAPDQIEIGLNAAWEIEALTELVMQAVELLPETVEERLAYRGVAQRASQLACVLMTLLGDNAGRRDTFGLTREVLGLKEAQRRYPDGPAA